jgi:hypothetical protein
VAVVAVAVTSNMICGGGVASVIVMVMNLLLMPAVALEICGGRVAPATLEVTSTRRGVVEASSDVEAVMSRDSRRRSGVQRLRWH